MKPLIITAILVMLGWASFQTCATYSDSKDPYSEGMHWDYSIRCEEGFLWKYRGRAAIPVLHSDREQVRCGETRH